MSTSINKIARIDGIFYFIIIAAGILLRVIEGILTTAP